MKRSSLLYTYCYCEENVYKMLEKMCLAIAVCKRKASLAENTDSASGVSETTKGDDEEEEEAPNSVVMDPQIFDDAVAVFISTYNEENIAKERKNHWQSQFPICVRDVDHVLANSDSQQTGSSSSSPSPYVFWDYHVIAMFRHKKNGHWYVVDFDSKITPPSTDDTVVAIRADVYFRISFFPSVKPRGGQSRLDHVRLVSASEKIRIKLVPATQYLTSLRSDRSHMLVNGKYNSPPPSYPCILESSPVANLIAGTRVESDSAKDTQEEASWRSTNNLACWINMSNTVHPPEVKVFTREELQTWLMSKSRFCA